MRTFVAIVLLLAPAVSAETVQGRVTADGYPLPGCTVTLSAGDDVRRRASDARGRYSFEAVRPGSYTLTVELQGFVTEEREIAVREEITRVGDVEVRLDPRLLTETLTVTCINPVCSTSAPETPFSQPACDERDLNTTLIESAVRGDASAIAQLRQRHGAAYTYSERHRIAGALLGRVDDDSAYWNELHAHAANAIRFAYDGDRAPQEFLVWCEARAIDPAVYRTMSLGALAIAGRDPRGHGMMLEALESTDSSVVTTRYAMLGRPEWAAGCKP